MTEINIEEMIDSADLLRPAPTEEPARQYYYIKKARQLVKEQSQELGRPLTACSICFGCQMNARDSEKLCGIPGVGCFKSCRLKAVAEIAKRIHETDAFSRISYDSPSSIADAYMEKMRHEPVEEVMLVMFDNKLHMIGEKCISRGTVNSAIASPREIFIYALEHHAVHIVLIHNHPSGDTTPSENDVEMTERVRNTGNIIGISLLDHIIIGDRRYTSFKEKGFLH